MAEGTIGRLVRERGFGFIRADTGGEEVFFHASAVADGSFDTLQEGQRVQFESGQDPRGRGMRAENVRVVGGS